MKRGPKGRKIIKGLIFALCTVGILWIWYFLLTDHFKYNCEEISPWMDECVEYVKLEKDVVLTQEFIINQDGSFFLEAIETIFVNLPDDKKKGKLGISILNSNGSVIYEDVYEISDFVVGVYQKLEFSDIIPIQKKETYTLCFRAYDTDAIPYMLLQRDTVQNSLNRIAKVNDEIRSDSVLIKYHIGEKLSNVVKNIIISITIIFLSGCYHILWGLSPKVERRIMMLCCMIAMMPIVICGLYNRPYSDDLIFAKDAHKLVQEGKGIGSIIYSACETVVDYYYNWQGLYTSSFLHAVNPSIINEKAYMITTYILLLIFIITTYITIKNISVCFNVNMEKSRLFIAILLVTAFCQGLPSIREGLFWYTGAMSYIIHSYLILVNISFYCLYIKEQGKKTYLWIICSIILSVIITGGNHVTAFLNIMLLGLGNIYGIYKKNMG